MTSEDSAPPDWREWRRVRALQLKQDGWKQCDLATALGVSAAAVSQWLTWAQQGGAAALHTQPRPGVPPRLTPPRRQA